jgi:hypothetical protein
MDVVSRIALALSVSMLLLTFASAALGARRRSR